MGLAGGGCPLSAVCTDRWTGMGVKDPHAADVIRNAEFCTHYRGSVLQFILVVALGALMPWNWLDYCEGVGQSQVLELLVTWDVTATSKSEMNTPSPSAYSDVVLYWQRSLRSVSLSEVVNVEDAAQKGPSQATVSSGPALSMAR